jgi:two-component system sensor histidine kinase PilS (NtrC family)
MSTAAASLSGMRRAPASDAELARRIRWLMLVRTLVISLVLGVSWWLSWVGAAVTSGTNLLLSGIIAATYASTLVSALLLRGGADPQRLVWPQLGGDLAVTSILVYATGGAQSAFTFLFALSIVGAGALKYERGAGAVAIVSVGLMILVGLAARERALPIPMVPQVAPWAQGGAEFARAVALDVAAIVAVGALSFVFGDQLKRTAASLATERRTVAELVGLHEDIVRSLTSGLITTDPEWRVLTTNQSAADILGVDPDGAVGRDLDELLPGVRERLAGVPASAAIRRADLTLPRDGARLVLGISVSPLVDQGGAVVGRVINFQDLTELRRMEREVQRAERMATVGQLAAGIAHEIRNPLASISGSVELLRAAPQLSGDDLALMEIVNREIDRLNGLITQLLEYASPRPRQVVDFDLGVMLDETVRVFQQDKTFADVEITMMREVDAVMMAADPAKLRQVAWNLLRNGAEAAVLGGRHVHVSLAADDRWAVLEIGDDGPGIAAEQVPRIFDPFFTTKKRGTGLGLATCQAIVTEHGGTIEVASEVGQGTRFSVRLPRRAPESTAEVPAVLS